MLRLPFYWQQPKKNRRTFFKIIDAAVVVAHTPLLINDRFCSRTSSLRCRQYCLSSDSLSPSEASSRVHIWRTEMVVKKTRRKKKMPGVRSRTLKRRERDRHASSTRVISRPATHAHRCLAITTRINTVDDYQNRRRKRKKNENRRELAQAWLIACVTKRIAYDVVCVCV
jgi:hypothetical protein